MQRKYTIADVNIQIDAPFAFDESGAMRLFAGEFDAPCASYNFELVPELPQHGPAALYQRNRTRVYRAAHGLHRYYEDPLTGADMACLVDSGTGDFRVLILDSFAERFSNDIRLFDLLAIEHAILRGGGLIMHASFVLHRGGALLFTAPSGTGKSTQAELWRRHRGARVVNGDRAVIRRGGEGFIACGLPYSGSSGICENACAPITAVVMVEQAPHNRVRSPNPAEAFRRIFEGCAVNTWHPDDVTRAYELIERLVCETPTPLLECLPDVGAVEALEAAICTVEA
ncbi:MAG: hypothetical protein Q4B99_02900 [Clostridia bacterium]|nr:hypothetical protein [Clostridia bacterium]